MPVSNLTVESASRVERKRAKNRDALIGAARRLFASEGFEATTVAGIAEAADLGFGTFYRYFPDKESILQAVLDAGRAEMDEVLLGAAQGDVTASESLARLTASFARAGRRNHDVLQLMWQVAVRGDAPGARAVGLDRVPPARHLPVMLAEAIRRIVERGIASGEFHAVDPTLVSRLLSSAHMYILSPSALETDEAVLVEAVREFELRALCVQPEVSTAGRRSG